MEIETQRGQSPYAYWTIGITDNPTSRRGEHDKEGKNTKYWHDWKADSEIVARRVEEWFLRKRMKGGTSGETQLIYVYIF